MYNKIELMANEFSNQLLIELGKNAINEAICEEVREVFVSYMWDVGYGDEDTE